jgi:hypothetical protein
VAKDSIKTTVERYYATNYPAVAASKQTEIAGMITELQGVRSRNYFPAMKSNWKAYPDNIGHMYFLGCFRCHDGKHVSETGKVLTNDCNTCHTILAQKNDVGAAGFALEGSKYLHPTDISDSWKHMTCRDCHNPPAGSKPLVTPVVGSR